MENHDESEGGQTRSHGQGRVGRLSISKDDEIALKMTNHTLDLVKAKLSVIGAPIGKHEAERARAELESEIDLAMRTIAGVMRRGAK